MKTAIKTFLELNHVREDTPITGKACGDLIERYASQQFNLSKESRFDKLVGYIKTEFAWYIEHSPEYGVIPKILRKASELSPENDKPAKDEKTYCTCINEGWTIKDGITICRNCLKPISATELFKPAKSHSDQMGKDEISNDWINEILDKTHDFAKQLIKNHFERHPQSSPSPAEITEEVFYVCEKSNNGRAIYWTGNIYMAEGDSPMWTQNIDNAFRSGDINEINGLISLYSLEGKCVEHMYMSEPPKASQQPKREVSDEEIEITLKEMYSINHRDNLDRISENRNHIQLDKRIGFREGAKWMRNRLTGTNKE
jgi:hypothetical protein